jgi:DNA-binding XRE family transcriptional regulator
MCFMEPSAELPATCRPPAPASPLAAPVPGQDASLRALPAPQPPPPPDAYVIDGVALRQLRRQHGLSQEKLAWDSGVGLTTLARLEREPRPRCRPRTLYLLARTLGENPAAIALHARRPASTSLRAIPGQAATST